MQGGDAATAPRPAGAGGRWRSPGRIAAVTAASLLALIVAGWIALAAGAGTALLRPALEAKLGRRVAWAKLAVDHAPEGLRLRFSDVHVGQPREFGPGDLAHVPQVELVVRPGALLLGRLEAPVVTLTSPELHLRRRGPGHDNWTFGKPGGGGASGLLGATRALTITGGRVDMDDPQRQVTLAGAFSHDPSGPLPLHLDGGGVLKGEPYRVAARGGPLDGRKPHAPHPVQVRMQDGATTVDLSGTTQAPFDFRGLDMDIRARGPNLADLVYLFNLLAPNSPPFTLTGHMLRQDKHFRLDRLQAQLGASDLEGSVDSVHLARRRIDARLSSHRLTAADLRILLASPPPHAVTRVSPGVEGRGGGTQGHGRLLSSTPVSLRRLGNNDATLRLHVDRADGFGPAIGGVDLTVSALGGRLAVAPLSFGVAGGTVRVDYTLDTASQALPARLSARVRGLQLARATRGGFSGRLDAEVEARGEGASVARQAASADGRLGVRVTAGSLPKRDAAALSGDLLGLVGAFLSPKGRAPLRCAAADFAVQGGVATATRLVVATDGGRATGGGRIDLRDETLGLRLEASSQGAHPPVQLRVPIVVTGSLRAPHVTGKPPPASAGVSDVFRSLKRLVTGGGPAAAAPSPGC